MFKVNNKDTRMTPCSSVSIVNFKHVNAGWVRTDQKMYYLHICNFVYDLIYDFFLSKDFQSIYIIFDIFSNLTFFDKTEKTNEK